MITEDDFINLFLSILKNNGKCPYYIALRHFCRCYCEIYEYCEYLEKKYPIVTNTSKEGVYLCSTINLDYINIKNEKRKKRVYKYLIKKVGTSKIMEFLL